MSWWSKFFGSNVVYEKDYAGQDTYFIEGNQPYSRNKQNLYFALDHPILTPALLFISNLFAQARFEVRNKKTGEVIENTPFNKLLNNPNYFQTRIDFLEAVQFLKIAQGRAIIWLKRPVGFSQPTAMYVLRDDLIVWPEGFNPQLVMTMSKEQLGNIQILYDSEGLRQVINISDLMFLFDLPNVGRAFGMGTMASSNNNMYDTPSRLDGLEQTLWNTVDSLQAKNTILKTNGKEMLSRANGGEVSFTPEQQEKAKRMFNTGYGPGKNRSRAFITSANVTWQSMHVALRDLGLDESVKTDGNIIYTALHIPKDILSLEAKKTTYNNFKESMTSFIQNDITAMANDFAEASWKQVGNDEVVIVATYEHLPVMQFAKMQMYEAVNLQAQALNNLLKTGVKKPDALRMVGLPTTMQLDERQDISTAPSTPGTTANSQGNKRLENKEDELDEE